MIHWKSATFGSNTSDFGSGHTGVLYSLRLPTFVINKQKANAHISSGNI